MNTVGIHYGYWTQHWDSEPLQFVKRAQKCGFDILEVNAPKVTRMSDSERDAMDQAWCRVLKDWDSIVATASERAWVATSYRKGALAVLYLRSLFFGDEIPRSATLAYTKNRAFTNGDALQFTETAKGSAPDSSGINPHRSPTPAWRWLVRI